MKKLLALLVVTSMLSCTYYEKIEDFPIETPRLVVNEIFTEGEPFVFRVSRSLSVLDNAALNHVTDAQLILYRNQVAIDTIKGANDEDYYRSNIIPERGYDYHVSVSHKGYDDIFSQREKLPAPITIQEFSCVLIDSVTRVYERWNSNKVDTLVASYVLDCSLTLLDQGETENIYSLGMLKYDSLNIPYGGQEGWVQRGAYILMSDDPSLVNNTGIGSDRIKMDRLFFKNDLFAGKEYTFNFTVEDTDWGTTLHREYTLLFYSYSHSSYMYARSRNFGRLWQSTPFDEPNSVYTNIEGGYGIFAGIEGELIPLRR